MQRRRTIQPGFTLLEMVLAIGLSSLVVLGSMSVLGMLYRSENRLARIAEDTTDLAVTQEVVRRTMQSLVAGTPLTDEEQDILDSEEGGEDKELDPESPEDVAELISQATGLVEGAEDDEASLLEEMNNPRFIDTRTHFELHYVASTVGLLPRLEVVVFDAPIAPPPIYDESDPLGALSMLLQDAAIVRGAFELTPLHDGWALQWIPYEPWAPATTLVRDLEYIEWQVLPRQSESPEWQSLHAAYLAEDFPVAVRLIIWTANGSRVDWLFRTEVIPGDSR